MLNLWEEVDMHVFLVERVHKFPQIFREVCDFPAAEPVAFRMVRLDQKRQETRRPEGMRQVF